MQYPHQVARTLPTTGALQAFESAAFHLSITQASKELHLTQGAISRQIQALEEHLGAELFVRERQRIRLSVAGEHYLAHVRAAFDRLEAAALATAADVAGRIHLEMADLARIALAGDHPAVGDDGARDAEAERQEQHAGRATAGAHAVLRERALADRPFEMRPVAPGPDPLAPTPMAPQRMVWLRTSGRLPDDPALHRYLLAYASDYSFVTTALLPHGVTWLTPGMQIASLDHVMWFLRPFRVDEWLLHVMESPKAHGGRGLVRGRVFTRDGRLVASTAQEGLIRKRSKPVR